MLLQLILYINLIFHCSVTRRDFGGSQRRSLHPSSGVQLQLLVQQRKLQLLVQQRKNLKEARNKTAPRVQLENPRKRRKSQVNRELRL